MSNVENVGTNLRILLATAKECSESLSQLHHPVKQAWLAQTPSSWSHGEFLQLRFFSVSHVGHVVPGASRQVPPGQRESM